MNATGDSTNAAINAIALGPALRIWTAMPDKNKTNMNEQSTPILVVKSSDTSLCGGKAHLRVKKMSAASDRNNAVTNAVTNAVRNAVINVPAERLIDILLAAAMATNFE